MRRIIRLGDSTSHGGKVVGSTSHMTVGGLPVARLGDQCTCPKRGHNNCVIVEGDQNWTIDGIPVALEGCKLSCGAVLISSMPNAGRVYDGGGSSAGSVVADNNHSNIIHSKNAESPTNTTLAFDEQIRIRDEDGNPIANVPFFITDESGNSFQGFSDSQGCCERIKTEGAQTLKILLGVQALEKW